MKSVIVCLCAGLVVGLVHVSSAGPPGGGQGGQGGNAQGFVGKGDGPQGKGGHESGGPGDRKGSPGQGRPQGPKGDGQEGLLEQLMSLDVNSDGALTPAEVMDPRLQLKLRQADVNGNGAVTREELIAAMSSQSGGPQSGGRPGGGGQVAPPRPGEILPGFVQDQLQLTDSQRQQLVALQAQVDVQLAQILTAQQLQQLAAGPPVGGPGGGPQAMNQNGNVRSKSGRSGKNKQ